MRRQIVALALAAAAACVMALSIVAGVVWHGAPSPASAPATPEPVFGPRVVIGPLSSADEPTARPSPTPEPTPTPEPRLAPASPPSVGIPWEPSAGVEQWRGLVAEIFPAEAVDRVLRVMTCESGGNPMATGGALERGLMQIHPIHADSTYDPAGNLRAAARISDYGRTFAAWDGPTPGRGDSWAAGAPCRGPYGGGS